MISPLLKVLRSQKPQESAIILLPTNMPMIHFKERNYLIENLL